MIRGRKKGRTMGLCVSLIGHREYGLWAYIEGMLSGSIISSSDASDRDLFVLRCLRTFLSLEDSAIGRSE